MVPTQHPSTKPSLLVLNRNILSGCVLVLTANEIRDLLVLCLFYRRLVILRALAENLLLN